MARNVKCYICKKDLNKEDAYMFTYTSQSGKEYRKYCCHWKKKKIWKEKKNYIEKYNI